MEKQWVRVVLVIEYTDDAVPRESSILETFEEAGDIDWKTTVISMEVMATKPEAK